MWEDHGSLRDEAAAATERGGAASRSSRRQAPVEIDAVVAATIRERAGPHRGARLVARLGEAADALAAERFDDARRQGRALRDELDGVAAVHRIAGLSAYRLGRWQEAIDELERAETVDHSVIHLPVLADASRALRRWTRVEEIWTAIRAESPAPEVMAEGRIVAAGAAADRGDLPGAMKIMESAPALKGRKVKDHHLRQWYVLADLYDRAGDPIRAVRLFRQIAEHDPDFVDVGSRLDALGR